VINWPRVLIYSIVVPLALAGYVALTEAVGLPKAITSVQIQMYEDGTAFYDRIGPSGGTLVVGYGEIREEGSAPGENRICHGNWTAAYDQPVDTTERDADWMVFSAQNAKCPLPLPVGAEWLFIWTPLDVTRFSATVKQGQILSGSLHDNQQSQEN